MEHFALYYYKNTNITFHENKLKLYITYLLYLNYRLYIYLYLYIFNFIYFYIFQKSQIS